MAHELRSHSPLRARPVAELALEQLLARAEELAQSWAVALVLARAPADIGAVPLEDIAREGPSLCGQLLRALQSDAELDRLTGEGADSGRERSAPARRLGAIAGAGEAPSAIVAVEALRGVLWEALLHELRWSTNDPSAWRQVAEVSDRLAHVCARALGAALAAPEERDSGEAGEVVVVAVSQSPVQDPRGEPAPRAQAVIVDERPGDTAAAQRSVPGELAPPRSPAASAERPLSWDESPPVPPASAGAEIEIRDERGEEGPTAWIGSIGRQLERYGQDGLPFAVLLLEPFLVDRLDAEAPQDRQRLSERLEQAIATACPGPLTRQSAARYWLLAPATNRLGATELAERLRQDVASAVSYRGEPLELVIGTASCPDDGLEAFALAAHADVGLYAARSAVRAAHGRAPAGRRAG